MRHQLIFLVAFLSNYLIAENVSVEAWRWMIGIEVLSAVIYTLKVFTVPKSPRWLMSQGKKKEAKYLKIIFSDKNPEAVIANMEAEEAASDATETIFMQKNRFPLILAFLIAFFNQFSGINALLYYSKKFY